MYNIVYSDTCAYSLTLRVADRQRRSHGAATNGLRAVVVGCVGVMQSLPIPTVAAGHSTFVGARPTHPPFLAQASDERFTCTQSERHRLSTAALP